MKIQEQRHSIILVFLLLTMNIFQPIFQPFSSVSIANFEQVNPGLVVVYFLKCPHVLTLK